MFKKLTIDVAACPCLTGEPFNLAGVGLSGNASIIEVGNYTNFMSTPQYDTAKWNFREILSLTTYDSFIIGSDYAAKPYMPYNGHLIMNAVYRAPTNITNASRIAFADNGRSRIEMLTDPYQIMCSFVGNFFVSEGRNGNVLRVRAKGRESNLDIITIMQGILYKRYCEKKNCTVALGGVLRIKNGRMTQNIMPGQYPPRVSSFIDLARWFQYHNMYFESDLIAVGTIVNTKSIGHRS
ncbi:ester hydrolase C11orf54 homolog isoform X2 [Temnothorax longispinosus]